MSEDKVREDVEEGEEGEGVGRIHPINEPHRTGESGRDAAKQPFRQHQQKKQREKITTILAGDILAELAPVKACLMDPTVSIYLFQDSTNFTLSSMNSI